MKFRFSLRPEKGTSVRMKKIHWRAGRLNVMELWTEQIIQAHAGDKDARNRLVAENLGLVHAVTRRFEHRGHDRENCSRSAHRADEGYRQI